MKKKIPVIINCDTGIDDAVALILATKSGKLDIRLIVTDLGNVDPKKSAKNTNNILELIHAPQIPVVAGEGKCLKKERPRVAVHGNGGLGDFVFDPNDRKVIDGDAVETFYQALMNSEEKVTIISLSPVTNLAKLIIKHPDCLPKIDRLVFMVGSIEPIKKGEMPYPEFNMATDPEAGEIVFASGIKIEIVPMEMGHSAYLDWQDVFKTKCMNNTGTVLEYIFRSYKDRHVQNGIAMHDGCAIAYVTNPELFETKPAAAEIKYFDDLDTGVLSLNFNKKPNVSVCTGINIKKFKTIYFDALKKCK